MEVLISNKSTIKCKFKMYESVKLDEIICGDDLEDIVQQLNNKNGEDAVEEKELIDVELSFAKPGFKINNILISTLMKLDPETGKVSSDVNKYQEARLKLLLKDWNLKDSSGTKLPVTAEIIDDLHPAIGTMIMKKMDENIPNYFQAL